MNSYIDIFVPPAYWHHDVKLVAKWIKDKGHINLKLKIRNDDDVKREILRIILSSKIEFDTSAELDNAEIDFEELDVAHTSEQLLKLNRGDIVVIAQGIMDTHNMSIGDFYRTKPGKQLPSELFGE